jgi:SAM-dependent methyltransferase
MISSKTLELLVCPKAIAQSYDERKTVQEIPLSFNADAGGNLVAGESHYTVQKGVPLLYDPNSGDKAREQFYENHYTGRSRLVDIASPYLASERKALADFVRLQGIRGPCLEIGCGTGMCADLVPGYLGLEFSYEALFAEGFDGYDRVAGSAEAIPLRSKSVELVFSFNVLEHVPKADRAFDEIDRVLRHGGYVFLKPAWNTSTIQTKLLTERSYRELGMRDKLHKMLVPVLRSKLAKAVIRIPSRCFWLCIELLTADRKARALRFRSITPWLGPSAQHVADSDACSQIDIFAAIQYFDNRGYKMLSHSNRIKQLSAGHDILIAKKPI